MGKVNFDDYAENYRNIHTQNIKGISGADSFYFAKYKVDSVRKMEQSMGNSPACLLDLGCGDGVSSQSFTETFSSLNYFGLDISEKGIMEAQCKYHGDRIHFQTYDGKFFPFEDNSFDVVFVACVFHHLDDATRIQIVKEIFRVLKNGGRFYCFEHNPYNVLTQYAVRTCPFDEDARLISSSAMQSLVKNNQFSEVSTSFHLFFPRTLSAIIPLEEHLHWLPIGAQYCITAIK